jgi:hypothetical protein
LKVTGENVAKAIIDYVLENYKRNGYRKNTNSQGATNQFKPDENFAETISRIRNEYL